MVAIVEEREAFWFVRPGIVPWSVAESASMTLEMEALP